MYLVHVMDKHRKIIQKFCWSRNSAGTMSKIHRLRPSLFSRPKVLDFVKSNVCWIKCPMFRLHLDSNFSGLHFVDAKIPSVLDQIILSNSAEITILCLLQSTQVSPKKTFKITRCINSRIFSWIPFWTPGENNVRLVRKWGPQGIPWSFSSMFFSSTIGV